MGLLVSPVQAKNTLVCTIVDQAGNPVAKQEFVLTAADGKTSKKKTNDEGIAKFGGLNDGSYTLTGEVPGYAAAKSLPMEVSGNTEQPCKYVVVSAEYANAQVQETMNLVKQRKFAEAETMAKQLLTLMPNEGLAHYVLAVVHAYQGKPEAETEVDKAAALSDRFADKVVPIKMQYLNQSAEMFKQKKDFPGAIKNYESMLVLSPNDPTVHYNMAITYAAAKDIPEALKNIELVLIIKPDDQEAKQLKARLDKLFEEQLNDPLKK